MGHRSARDGFEELAGRLDSLGARTPYTATLRAILEELYSPQEAALVVAMPPGLSTLEEIRNQVEIPEEALRSLLEGLCTRGWSSTCSSRGNTASRRRPWSSGSSNSP